MHKIFISYSRRDKKTVFKLKEEIEQFVGKDSCWIDLTGIESDKQFIDVIIEAIDHADIFLFMYSQNSYSSEWSRKELEYANNEGKKIVFVNLNQHHLSKYYRFQFGGHDIIDISEKEQKLKLLCNLKEWTGKTQFEKDRLIKEYNSIIGNACKRKHWYKFEKRVFPNEFHPAINLGIAFQLLLYVLFLLMAVWTFLGGCLAFYQHPQLSHFLLIIALSVSFWATINIRKKQTIWLAIIFVLDFIEIYLVSHLGDFLFQNWHNFSKLAYPMSIRYQLLYSLGTNMKIHHFMGIHTYLIFLALSHIIIICSMLCIHKDGKSAWAYMK